MCCFPKAPGGIVELRLCATCLSSTCSGRMCGVEGQSEPTWPRPLCCHGRLEGPWTACAGAPASQAGASSNPACPLSEPVLRALNGACSGCTALHACADLSPVLRLCAPIAPWPVQALRHAGRRITGATRAEACPTPKSLSSVFCAQCSHIAPQALDHRQPA